MVELLVQRADIAYYERLQPPFRMQAPQGLMPCSLCATSGTQRLDKVGKVIGVPLIEDALLGADAKHDFLTAAERPTFVC